MDDNDVLLGSISPGVGRCWLVEMEHEQGPNGLAWNEAYSNLAAAKRALREMSNEEWVIYFEPMSPAHTTALHVFARERRTR